MFHSIGRNVQRTDGVSKVTGSAKFVADLCFPGSLHARILRSTVAHGRISEINCETALALPGVVAIVTGDGVFRPAAKGNGGPPVGRPFGTAIADQYPLAREKVRFAGEPVAAVIAVTEGAAAAAVGRITVRYEEYPFTLYPQDAVSPQAPIIHEGLGGYHKAAWVRAPGGNVYHHVRIVRGDAAKALQAADVVVENDYWSPYIHHVQLEPHTAVAQYQQDGVLLIHATTQAPFVVQQCVAELHGLPLNRVRVIVPYLGGGFGGKSDVTIEPLVSCLAMAVPGRPVKLALSREEMFSGTTVGRGAYCRYKTAADKDGRLLALIARCYLGSGGYADYAVNIVGGLAMAATGPYEIPNLSIDAYGVYTNTPPTGALRGYGHPEAHWAMERQIDMIARRLAMDATAVRLKNTLTAGRVNAIGQVMTGNSGRVDLCIAKVAGELFREPKPAGGGPIRVGRGLAAYMKTPIMPTNVQSGAILKLNGDGTVSVSVGAVEMGQGTYTALAQIAAEALNIPLERVSVVPQVDTMSSPYEWQTVASHTTWGVGNAILLAARDLLDKLRGAAAAVWGVPADDAVIAADTVRCQSSPDKTLTWADLALGYKRPDGQAVTAPLTGEGCFVARGLSNLDPETGQGNAAADWTFGCVGVELGVAVVTGEIHVYKLLNAIDAGQIINPQQAEGQVVGGMIQALGGALSEVLVFSDRGQVRNADLVDYKIPGYEDIPPVMKVMFVETPEESGPYGARGLGEHGAVAVAPAVANAVHDAVGVDFNTLPVAAGNLLARLKGGL